MAGDGSADDATAGPGAEHLIIEVWSDIVCPWCYIGKRRLERALTTLADDPAFGVAIDVVYRPFQLDPTAPFGRSEPVVDAYARKFGGVERAKAMIEHVTRIAADEGLEFHLDRARRANTADAHRMLWWTLRDHGAVPQAALKERLMAAYFTEGADVGDLDVLARCATDVGLDADVARRRLGGDEGVESLAVGLQRAADLGITAVPTYVLASTWSIPGAQDAETFTTVLRRAAALAGDAP
jgi:predicted DsbA family dithiol-disulfide isomerase